MCGERGGCVDVFLPCGELGQQCSSSGFMEDVYNMACSSFGVMEDD